MAQFRPHNQLVFHRIRIDPTAVVQVTAKGSGCAVVQMTLHFNSRHFERHARLSPFSARGSVKATRRACDRARMRTCMRYNPSVSGSAPTMVIMKTKMASGWRPQPHTRSALQAKVKSGDLRMVEEESDKSLVLYYDPISQSEVCSQFDVERYVEIEDVDPMILQVYDYYQPEQVVEVNLPVYTGECAGVMKAKVSENKAKSHTCPVCADDEASVVKALGGNCASKNQSMNVATLIWAHRGSQLDINWTLRLVSAQDKVIGWRSSVRLGALCKCKLTKEAIMISSKRQSVATGQSLVMDDSWTIINPSHLKSAYGTLQSPCKTRWNFYPVSAYLS